MMRVTTDAPTARVKRQFIDRPRAPRRRDAALQASREILTRPPSV
jgi:hypothetical protein